MTSGLDAVLFDAGGVIWDLRPSVEELFAEVLGRHGVSCSPRTLGKAIGEAERALDAEFASLDGDESGFWRRYDGIVLDRVGAQLDVDVFARDLGRRMRDAADEVGNWVAYPDAVPALEDVRRRGLGTGLVSNATELARRVLRNLDMERFFDNVVISEEVGVRKPDPGIFRIALDGLGVDASRALFLGDRPATDMAGAEAAGMRGVLVDRRDTFAGWRSTRIRDLDALAALLRD